MFADAPLPSFPAQITLSDGDVHVIGVRLDSYRDDTMTLLDEPERSRANRFLRDRDRFHYIASRSALRTVLGRVLARDPVSLSFTAGAHGKPALAGDDSVRFNVSHAGGCALIALSARREVGVDIEQERDIDELSLADRFFSPAEAAELRALPRKERRAAFFRVWTRKEAFVKAIGDGLSYPLDTFEVTHTVEPAIQTLRACKTSDAVDLWRVTALPAPVGFAAALAAEAGAWQPVGWDGIVGFRSSR